MVKQRKPRDQEDKHMDIYVLDKELVDGMNLSLNIHCQWMMMDELM